MLRIRSATELDSPDIYRVHVAAVHSLSSGAEADAGIEEWLASRAPSLYAQEMQKDYFVVAEEGGELLAWGALDVTKEEITNVFVHPEHHRKSIGTAILAKLEAAAREARLAAVQLQATGTAIDFYLAVGYQSDPPVAPGAKWALMKKTL